MTIATFPPDPKLEQGWGRYFGFCTDAKVIGIQYIVTAFFFFLIGGLLAAPLGAWAAKHFNPKTMLILVGVVLTLTSLYGVYRAWL